MKLNCKAGWWPLDKHNHLLVKLAVSILLVGVAFRLLSLRSTGFSEDGDADTPFIKQGMKTRPAVSVDFPENGTKVYTKPPVSSVDLPKSKNQIPENGTQVPESGTKVSDNSNPPVFVDSLGNRDQNSKNGTQVSENPKATFPIDIPENRDRVSEQGKCDLFTGDWIPTSVGPLYTNESCSLIEGHQNCMKNGRPDTGYLYWRWNPRDCELPPFNGELFLELMRNKTWALIGDSISRNHVQSLLCILSKVEQAVEVYHDKEYRSKRWHFPSYNFTISVLWSPFLAKAATFEDDNGVSTANIELHLDKLDPTWTDQYQSFNYMIFSTGEWFVKTAIYYENNTVLGCHNCPQKNQTELGFNFAYRKALESVFNFIVASNHKGMIFYRTSTPDHFENGEWYNGGNCQRTSPVKEGEFKMNELTRILRGVELEEFGKAAAKASRKGIKLKLFDVMNLSLLRPDGHPGLFRHFHPFAMENTTKIYFDCLHWCLPGPIDSWNDLLMEMVVNG